MPIIDMIVLVAHSMHVIFNILRITSLEMLVWIPCEYPLQLTQRSPKLTTLNAGKVIGIISFCAHK